MLRRLSRPADPGTTGRLRRADIDSWSRVDGDMVAFARSLHTAPAGFLFVDDREESVRAARAAGMAGHVFTRPEALVEAVDAWPAAGAEPPASSR